MPLTSLSIGYRDLPSRRAQGSSWTKRAPFIDPGRGAARADPRAAKRSESPRRPSSSGGAVVTAKLLAALIEQAHIQTLPR